MSKRSTYKFDRRFNSNELAEVSHHSQAPIFNSDRSLEALWARLEWLEDAVGGSFRGLPIEESDSINFKVWVKSWRDLQGRRVAESKQKQLTLRVEALSKLTPEERAVLGV